MVRITVYRYKDDRRKIIKDITNMEQATVQGDFTGEISITHPVIDFDLTDGDINLGYEFNYLYIDKFDRYYFIDDMVIVRDGLVRCYCSVDVLMSFQTSILQLSGLIERTSNVNFINTKMVDTMLPVESGSNKKVYTIRNTLFDTRSYIGVFNTAGIYLGVRETYRPYVINCTGTSKATNFEP